jgi:small subunit ribosomal protein S8
MDPIADLLTGIRNANARMKDRVDVPYSKIKFELVRILKDEGFIANYKSLYPAGVKYGILRVFLKYSVSKETAIRGLKRVSKPGLRIYRSYQDLPLRNPNGMSVSILSTSAGILTERQAQEKKIGGEVLCQVW